jgi:hypothetical protein
MYDKSHRKICSTDCVQTQHLLYRKPETVDMLHIPHPFSTVRQMAILGIVGVLFLVLSACGPNPSSTATGSGSGSTTDTPTTHSTPTPTITTGGYGSIHGCPSNTVVSTPLKQANVTIRNTDVNSTVIAHVGDTIEVLLPFGQKWGGPIQLPTNLEQQQPAGYAFIPDNVCIWRFVAQNTGIANLDFTMQALCVKGVMCPMYIANVTFTVNVK